MLRYIASKRHRIVKIPKKDIRKKTPGKRLPASQPQRAFLALGQAHGLPSQPAAKGMPSFRLFVFYFRTYVSVHSYLCLFSYVFSPVSFPYVFFRYLYYPVSFTCNVA